jgi:outer membrane protein TolC
MAAIKTTRGHIWNRILGTLAAPLICPLLAVAQGPDVVVIPPEPPAPEMATTPARPLTLADCVQIALDRQPALTAHRASVAAAEGQRQGLDNLRLAGLVSREVPIRRKQAGLGVVIASAGAMQAEWETIYAVTRNYFSVLYAREQEKVAADVIGDLKATYLTAKGFVDEGTRRNVNKNNLDQILTYQLLAESRLVDAQRGAERSLAALREAMGVEPGCKIEITQSGLPVPRVELTRDQVIQMALGRRGELTQAVNVAEVLALEVDAQGTSCLLSFRTFASMVDLHARPIPQGFHNGDYRPEAVGLEMPTHLAGKRQDRINRARDLNTRADAVVEKTRNLIALEAENTFLKWQEANDKIPKTQGAAQKAIRLGKDTQKNFAGDQNVTVRDVLDALVLDVQARVTHNEVLYRHLLALADLQRVTAGGYSIGLDGQAGRHP